MEELENNINKLNDALICLKKASYNLELLESSENEALRNEFNKSLALYKESMSGLMHLEHLTRFL
jgi:hypothetical protein